MQRELAGKENEVHATKGRQKLKRGAAQAGAWSVWLYHFRFKMIKWQNGFLGASKAAALGWALGPGKRSERRSRLKATCPHAMRSFWKVAAFRLTESIRIQFGRRALRCFQNELHHFYQFKSEVVLSSITTPWSKRVLLRPETPRTHSCQCTKVGSPAVCKSGKLPH